jgi:16S rRNA (guanine1207-N2)-methyltransferase
MRDDLALNWIIQQIQSHNAQASVSGIWCTDENTLYSLPPAQHQSEQLKGELLVATNRWDIYQQALKQQFNANFSDFDLSAIADNSLDYFYYRVSKEKPVVHHLLNEAWRCLKPDGLLMLAGHKNEGIKTYIEKIARCFGCAKAIEKNTTAYNSSLRKHNAYNPELRLDDSDYTQLRPLPLPDHLINLNIETKPGLFGWNKIDQGSSYLLEQLPAFVGSFPQPPKKCLDLGCGYGYLTLAASQLPSCNSVEHWLLTDNNAAAASAVTCNIQLNQLSADLIVADCADSLSQQVDLVLCNPPFHQGFSPDGDLTDKFLAAAHRLLTSQGAAIFVVNQFIPLERKAAGLFGQIQLLADNGSFKVISLKK